VSLPKFMPIKIVNRIFFVNFQAVIQFTLNCYPIGHDKHTPKREADMNFQPQFFPAPPQAQMSPCATTSQPRVPAVRRPWLHNVSTGTFNRSRHHLPPAKLDCWSVDQRCRGSYVAVHWCLFHIRFIQGKWVALPTRWRASVRALFYCYHTFLDHRTNINRKVRALRCVSASGAPLIYKTYMEKTSMHLCGIIHYAYILSVCNGHKPDCCHSSTEFTYCTYCVLRSLRKFDKSPAHF